MSAVAQELAQEPEPEPELSEEEQKIRQFCGVCGVDESTAHQQLESAGWDVQRAVDNFLAAQAAEEERRKRQEALAAAAAEGGQGSQVSRHEMPALSSAFLDTF